MSISGEMTYHIGLMLISFSALIAAILIPILLTSRKRLRKQLEKDYGKHNR